MSFRNPIIGGGGALVYPSIHSPDFVHLVSGWSINKDGSAEFTSIIVPPGSGGTTVFVQGTTPTANNVGDIWYNSANGNEASRWSGTAWVPFQLGAGAILPGSITAALLVAGIIVAGIVDATTITGAKIIADGSAGQVLVYSGTPASGNLIASVSGAAGTDSHGNHYVIGFGSYNGTSLAQLRDGILHLGSTADTALAELTAGGGSASLTSGTTGLGDTDAEMELMSANTSGGIGLPVASFPQQVTVTDDVSTSVLSVLNLQSGPSSPVAQLTASAPGDSTLGIEVGADAHNRLNVDSNGKMSWGSGSAAQDTNLYRGGASLLQTDDSLTVGQILTMTGGSDTAPGATVRTPGFANGTASQLSDTTRDYMVYLQIGTAGTAFSLKIGASNPPGNNIYVSATPPAGMLISFRLPAGWFVQWAGTGTTLAMQRAVSC